MEGRTCCFSGHRDIPPEEKEIVADKLRQTLIYLIDKGFCNFAAGGALGFDTLAAEAVLSLKEDYPHIKLMLILPCRTQTKFWSYKNQVKYYEILDSADSAEYVSEAYTSSCMHERNRRLVDCSEVLICYLSKDSGGTASTVRYAKSKNLKIINLA